MNNRPGELKKDAIDSIKGIAESYEPKSLTAKILMDIARFVHGRISKALPAK